MMNSPIMRFLGMASWLITALASLNIGTAVVFGFDFFRTDFMMMTMPSLMMPLYYLIGIAGLWSLIGFVKKSIYGCESCK